MRITCNPTDINYDEQPSRPKVIKLFVNRPKILGFDDGDSVGPTQEITLSEKDWGTQTGTRTGTAKLELRFIRLQNVYGLVVFIVESEGDNEKVRT